MIYICGMSHLLAILGACSPSADYFSHIANEREPSFLDWETRPGMLGAPLKAANLFLEYYIGHWGAVLARREADVLQVAPGFTRLLAGIDGDDPANILFVTINGIETLRLSIAQPETPYDFVVPGRADLPLLPHRQIIPTETMLNQLRVELRETIAILTTIRMALPRLRIVSIMPPPVVSERQCRAFPTYLGKIFPGAPLQTTSIRVKHQLLYLHWMAQVNQSLKIDTLPPPEEAIAADGTLADRYAGDIIHGNVAYGALVVAQMDALLRAGR